MLKLAALRSKTYHYVIDDCDENKKVKGTKECVIKRKFKFEDYKNFLAATQLKNEINHLENNKIDVDGLKECHKIFQE